MTNKAKKNESRQCPQCSGPMICVAKRYSNPKKRATTKYRIRTFKCELCEHQENVYADGQRDDEQKYNPNVDTR